MELIAAHEFALVKAARWDFLMRAADDQAGPEALFLEFMDDEDQNDGRKMSEQAADAIDGAIAKLAAGAQ